MTIRRLLSLAAVLAVAGLVLAQPPVRKGEPEPKKGAATPKEPPKPAPGSLEHTLEKALRNSADIKAAEAKVREAEAELNRVRQQVLTKATALHADLNLAKRMLTVAEETFARLRDAPVAQTSLLAAQTAIEKHRGEVEKLETELKSMRGEFAVHDYSSPAFSPDGILLHVLGNDGKFRVWDTVSGAVAAQPVSPPAPAVQSPMVERVKQALDKELELDITTADPLEVMTTLIEVSASKIPVRVIGATDRPVPVQLKGRLPLGAWLQAVEDSDENLRIVVRDYGLLVTTRDRLPEGALRVQDLWKGKHAQVPKPDPKPVESKGSK